MPTKMKELVSALPVKNQDFTWGNLISGQELQPIPPLFPRIELEKTTALPENPAGTIPQSELTTIEDFTKIKLTTARVLTAENIPNTTKLLKLQIDLGSEKRQIVAGIAEHYRPEELVGKTIIVIANLQPAKIRGVESNGMLLAAKKDGKLCLLTTSEEMEPGATIS